MYSTMVDGTPFPVRYVPKRPAEQLAYGKRRTSSEQHGQMQTTASTEEGDLQAAIHFLSDGEMKRFASTRVTAVLSLLHFLSQRSYANRTDSGVLLKALRTLAMRRTLKATNLSKAAYRKSWKSHILREMTFGGTTLRCT
jgi:hypothetical protein